MTAAKTSRLLTIVLAASALAGLGLAAPGGAAHPRCADAAGAHHVALVVEHGNGSVVTRCVAFDQAALTGTQVMDMAQAQGVEYATAGYGGSLGSAVCQIDYEPASYPPGCWTSTSPYWAMFVSRSGGPWAVSSKGISAQTFSDGDALGWHYQPQVGGGGGPPPSPAGVCAQVVAAPPPAPVAGSQPAPAPLAPAPAAPGADTPSPDATPSPATEAAPTPSATPSSRPAATPTAGAATPARRADAGPAPSRVDPGFLLVSGALGGLLGLALLQVLAARYFR